MENAGFSAEEKPGHFRETSIPSDPNKDDAIVQLQKTAFTMSIPREKRITFSWEDITIEAKLPVEKGVKSLMTYMKTSPSPNGSSKMILRDARGYVRPGELLAIMGASGAGKSTLLNALTFRNLSGLKVLSGMRYANGVPVSPNSLTSVSAYVQQDDLFIGTLTVREHLVFQACVRMDRHIPYSDRMERVETVIQELGLTKCMNTLIGVPGRLKGISGGEMKRLSFASEVLTNPPLLFCDEPTSGLDSYMAQNVVEVLRSMASQGKTVVATIHQPSSQVFSMFNKILLMAEGRMAFLGQTEGAQGFFAKLGYPCPMNYNPADHYVHVLAVTPGKEEACKSNIRSICHAFEVDEEGIPKIRKAIEFEKGHARTVADLSVGQSKSPYKASVWEQFKALLWRSWLSVIKEPMIVKVRIIQTLLVAVVLGIIYFNQEYNQLGIMNISGAIFLMLTNTTFQNLFAVINVFCLEMPIFLREHFNGMYRTDVYYVCKQLAELPLFIFTSTLFVSIFYYMVGLNSSFVAFLHCLLVLVVMTQVVVGMGYFVSCISSNLQIALALGPTLIIPFLLFGGFFLNTVSIPDWLVWLKYLSWFLYANEAISIKQWEGTTFNCTSNKEISQMDNSTDLSIQSPCLSSGDIILSFYGFNKDNYWFDIGMLTMLALGYRILGFIFLLSKTYRKGS